MSSEVRFVGFCDTCGSLLREFYNTSDESNPYWVKEYHGLRDCIRYLVRKIEDLEERITNATINKG
jgi:hypothetical protein